MRKTVRTVLEIQLLFCKNTTVYFRKQQNGEPKLEANNIKTDCIDQVDPNFFQKSVLSLPPVCIGVNRMWLSYG